MRGYPTEQSVDVLFVAYGGGHVQMVIPVAQQLQADGVRVCVFALTTASVAIARTHLPYFTYADLPQAQTQLVHAIGDTLAEQLGSSSTLPHAETQAYLGLNYLELQKTYGDEEAERLWQNGGRQHFHPFETMKAVLADVNPRLVVATNSPRSERAAIEAATDLGVDAVAMVDMFALQEAKWLCKPNFGRHLFVLDESVKQMLIANGRDAEDISVTGNPAFDNLFDNQTISRAKVLRQERGWDKSGKVIVLYASAVEPTYHPYTGELADPSMPYKIEQELCSIVGRVPGFELVIRRHPSDSMTNLPDNPMVHISAKEDSISVLLHAVDLVIVTSSTVGLQAYLAGVPVLCVQGSVFSKDSPYVEYGMAEPVGCIDDLEQKIDSLLPIAKSLRGETTRDLACAAISKNILTLLRSA